MGLATRSMLVWEETIFFKGSKDHLRNRLLTLSVVKKHVTSYWSILILREIFELVFLTCDGWASIY